MAPTDGCESRTRGREADAFRDHARTESALADSVLAPDHS